MSDVEVNVEDEPEVEAVPAPIVVAPVIVTDAGGDDHEELDRLRAELEAEHTRAEAAILELGVLAGVQAERDRAEAEAAEEAAQLASESEAALPEPESQIPEETEDESDLEPRFWEGAATKDYWLPSVD